ncbi:hypothetical protein [Myroides indicus]|uniref:Uncharacterized protein n=1 Tax=Myroides indicus TaxID=1323422 RepID=A0A4R7ES17_9FLAO|nr:hypothetical protein [Myroides indicus]TDS55926.1 hypothetical protein C8P70_12147 [Myroides indicus]
MKKLFFIWLTLFSVSAFAQTQPNPTNEVLDFKQLEKEGYVQVAPDLGHNSEYQCWIGLIF